LMVSPSVRGASAPYPDGRVDSCVGAYPSAVFGLVVGFTLWGVSLVVWIYGRRM
jgi:hypothetical protein